MKYVIVLSFMCSVERVFTLRETSRGCNLVEQAFPKSTVNVITNSNPTDGEIENGKW